MAPRQPEKIIIDREELEEIIRHAVKSELEAVGLFSHEPKERQNLQQDVAWLRKMRLAFDGASATVGKAVMGAITVGVIGLIVAGAKLGLWPSPP